MLTIANKGYLVPLEIDNVIALNKKDLEFLVS